MPYKIITKLHNLSQDTKLQSSSKACGTPDKLPRPLRLPQCWANKNRVAILIQLLALRQKHFQYIGDVEREIDN
jgi:hypothetical protein